MQQPLLDVEMVAQRLEVRNQVVHGLRLEGREVVARPRGALPAPALVETHEEVQLGVETPSVPARAQTAARTPVRVQSGSAVGIAGRLPEQASAVRTIEESRGERRDGRVKHVSILGQRHPAPASGQRRTTMTVGSKTRSHGPSSFSNGWPSRTQYSYPPIISRTS